MNGCLYVIGPSNVGKSSACEALVGSGLIRHADLDAVLQEQYGDKWVSATQDWSRLLPAFGRYDELTTDPPTVLNLGAGTLDRDRVLRDQKAENWLSNRRDRVILIEGDRDELFERNAAFRGNRRGFDEVEFGPARHRIYATAGHQVSFAGADRGEATARLGEVIRRLMSSD